MAEPFFDPSEEPEALCKNCSYFKHGIICINKDTPRPTTGPEQTCRHFFPDFKRWPEADHD